MRIWASIFINTDDIRVVEATYNYIIRVVEVFFSTLSSLNPTLILFLNFDTLKEYLEKLFCDLNVFCDLMFFKKYNVLVFEQF